MSHTLLMVLQFG